MSDRIINLLADASYAALEFRIVLAGADGLGVRRAIVTVDDAHGASHCVACIA